MKVLIVSPTPTHPTIAGNRARIKSLMEQVASLGHETHLAVVEMESGDHQSMTRAWGHCYHSIAYARPKPNRLWWIRRAIGWRLLRGHLYYLPIDDWYDENTTDALKRLQAQHSFDVVIVEYVFLSKAFDAFDSSVLKILDTHDVMANRHRQYLAQGHRPAWFSTTNREESRALARAHVVLAIQEHEREHFKLLGAPDVSVVGHIIDVATASTSRLLTSVPSALFVGSTNPINLQALHWLRTEVWPLVRSRMSAILQVAGGICNELADGTDIVKLGQFGDLREAYESAHVVVNPVQTGTGLNIKSVEALGFAKPMVVTRIGARGLEAGANTAFVVAESPSEFADAIVRVLSDPSLAADLSNRSREFANRWNEAQLAQLQQVLNRKLRVA